MTDPGGGRAIAPGILLTVLQHGDSLFPSGAFGFSWGLEGMLAEGMLTAADLPAAIPLLLHNRWSPFDRVAVARAWRAADSGEGQALALLDLELEAALLAPVERAGSVRAGAALLAGHRRLGTPGAADLQARIREGGLRGHRPLVEGVLWQGLGLAEPQALALSAYGFAAALCSAAVRLGRLGALEQQAILAAALPAIAEGIEGGFPAEGMPALGSFNPLAEIAMMRQPLRDQALFAT